MFTWVRKIRIRRINLFGVELEFDHSAVDASRSDAPKMLETPEREELPRPTVEHVTPKLPNETDKERQFQPKPEVGPHITLTVYGEVVGTIDKDLGIRIRNEEEVREFWRVYQIDSMLDWMGKGPPVFSINRKEDKARCQPGDEASLTFVVQDRVSGKRGIKTVGFEVLRKG